MSESVRICQFLGVGLSDVVERCIKNEIRGAMHRPSHVSLGQGLSLKRGKSPCRARGGCQRR